MDESKKRFEAVEEAEKTMSEDEQVHDDRQDEEKADDDVADDDDEEFEEVGEQTQLPQFESSVAPIPAQFRSSQLETLAVNSSLQLPDNDLQSDFRTSSLLLSEVPVEYAATPPIESVEFKKATVIVPDQAAQAQNNRLQSVGNPTCSSESSPTSAAQSVSSTPYPTLMGQRPSLVVDVSNVCMQEVDRQKSNDSKITSGILVARTPSADGYNWRKYGQKQVKSPQGSRSYYKCTYSECFAKKIECSDHSSHVVEIICKGHHNHDPPRKNSCRRESRLALPCPNITAQPVRVLNDSDPSTSSKEPLRETPAQPEAKQQISSASEGNAEIGVSEEHVDEPEPKRRLKKSNSASPGSNFKAGKKPKFIVHAAGDVGISGDGYRWRKYGQKMVKGNPHPRNYYRCTSAGCPVRKHIERDVLNTTAVIITYKGVHDHDMPVPKKRHGPPSAPLVAAAAPASMTNLQFQKTEGFQNQLSATQWSVDTAGELKSTDLDIGEEKAMESARTLLSIGFEIKPC